MTRSMAPARPRAPAPFVVAAALGLALLVGCASFRRPPAEGSAASAAAQQVSVRGWFSVVWGEGARYFLTDDAGKTRELLVEEELMGPLGGPLALDRRRVRVTGEIAQVPAGAIRVASIQPDSVGR